MGDGPKSIERGLTQEGNAVATATTGEEGYYLATTRPFDAVVLDLMLPMRDGMQVLHDLRSGGFAVPILILTARDSIENRVYIKSLRKKIDHPERRQLIQTVRGVGYVLRNP